MGRWFEKTVERAPAALVFSGGGAKGSFEIGAWRAFREMGLEFDAVVGASVGSLNAALYAQGDYDLAEEIWSTVSIEQVVEVPRNLVTGGRSTSRGWISPISPISTAPSLKNGASIRLPSTTC